MGSVIVDFVWSNEPQHGVPGYDAWWDVPVAAVSEQPDVATARRYWEEGKGRQRYFL